MVNHRIQLDALFGALSDRTRRDMLRRLATREHVVANWRSRST